MTIASNALITKIELINYLEQAGHSEVEDENLETVINGVSTFFESYCDRTFHSTTYTEYLDGSGVKYLIPNHYPITSVTSIYDDSSWGWGGDYLVDSDDYRIMNDQNTILKDGTWATGDENIKLEYVAGYSTIPDDLKLACLQQCVYEIKMISAKQISHRTLPDGTILYENVSLISLVKMILNNFRRVSIL